MDECACTIGVLVLSSRRRRRRRGKRRRIQEGCEIRNKNPRMRNYEIIGLGVKNVQEDPLGVKKDI